MLGIFKATPLSECVKACLLEIKEKLNMLIHADSPPAKVNSETINTQKLSLVIYNLQENLGVTNATILKK